MPVDSPAADEVRELAYKLFDRRGGEHGWDVADWLMAERAVTFHKHYERIGLYRLDDAHKTWFGPTSPAKCRFCGKRSPEISFASDAHAVPASLGNRSLFVRDECDQCNHFFGRTIEDDFAKFIAPQRTLMRIHGRNGVPSYKTRSKATRIDDDDGVLTVRHSSSEGIVEVDEERGLAKFRTNSQPHVPLAAYKCLSKIAISILPESELVQFEQTLRWILDADHSHGAIPDAFTYMTTIPGPMPRRLGWVELFRRRDNSLPVPYLVLVIVTMNLAFQAYVPLCLQDDHLVGKEASLPLFPFGIHHGYAYGEARLWRQALSSVDSVSIPFNATIKIVGDLVKHG